MNRFKVFSRFGIALLIGASTVSLHAEEGEVLQTYTHDRSRTPLNLQVTTSEFGQSQNHEEHTVMNKNQHQYQYQYKHMNSFQNGKGQSGEGVMNDQNMAKNSWQGNAGNSSMNSMNATNRYLQGGSMNRTSAASRSMGRGRH